MEDTRISKTTLRRFILGKQGLWPGRRWRGPDGLVAALRACQAVQLDPLNVAARSHDIALRGRVEGYQPAMLDQAVYAERRFFDYGGTLFLYPMDEFRYWRLHMRRRAQAGRWAEILRGHADLAAAVLAELRERGPLGNRDFKGAPTVRGNYRGRKDTSLVLYALWLTGEIMVHHRDGFDRLYDLRERVIPAEMDVCAAEAEAEAYFARKTVAFHGLVRTVGFRASLASDLYRPVTLDEARAWLERLVEVGELVRLRVEGSKETWYALRSDLPDLQTLEAGEIPAAWQPLGATTLEQMVVLAPLEIASARGRAAWIFDFDYVWEVYKPVELRRWGYYTVPVLWGDRLVARLDPRLERSTSTLRVLGFWPEDGVPGGHEFVRALVRGLADFASLAGAARVDLDGVQDIALRARLVRALAGEVGERPIDPPPGGSPNPSTGE